MSYPLLEVLCCAQGPTVLQKLSERCIGYIDLMHLFCINSLVLQADQINGWEQDFATTLLELLMLFKFVFRQLRVVSVCTSCSKISTFFTMLSCFR